MSKKLAALIVILVIGVGYFVIQWQLAQSDLALAVAEVATAQAALGSNQGVIQSAQDEIAKLRAELQDARGRLSTVEGELQLAKDSLLEVEVELEDTRDELASIETGPLNLHDPTFKEALGFLEKDRTDTNEYLEDEYVCSHFAADVNSNAEEKGIRCAFVEVRFPSSGHAIIAFDTTDEELVYFDSMTDERVRPVIGKHYWQCIEPKPGYEYERPSFNDTIVDLVMVW
jgi:hypothetical protein